MDREVRSSETAPADLKEVHDFIARDVGSLCRGVRSEGQGGSPVLAEFFRTGQSLPEIQDQANREIFVRKYRLIYRVEADAVYILAFIHGARDFARIRRPGPLDPR